MSQSDTNGARFRVERVVLRGTGLPPGASPLRFVHLSDLHIHWLRRRHRQLLELVNEWGPDFIFLTGDLTSRNPLADKHLLRLLDGLHCRHGVFACRGNHEVKRNHMPSVLRRMLANCGVQLLVNEWKVVRTDSGVVRVSGLDDVGMGWPDFQSTLGNGIRADYHILLAHAPVAARFLTPQCGVDLLLSGHTHGGQLRVPVVWPILLPRGGGGFTHGLYRLEWGQLYVNRGFGGADLMPLRFRCPAEVTFFEVRPIRREMEVGLRTAI